jgi:hypothetical protein
MPSKSILERLKAILRVIYSQREAEGLSRELKNLMGLYGRSPAIMQRRRKYEDRVILDENDAVLITYRDTIYKEGEKPLNTLQRFLKTHVKNVVSGAHDDLSQPAV